MKKRLRKLELKTKQPEKAAAEVLKYCKVTNAPVPVEEIAKELGATIQFEPFDGKDDVSGMLFRDDARTIIGVNSTHARTRQRFSIAHECGHLQLHEGKMYVDARINFRDSVSKLAVDAEERAANAFAAALLMPSTFVIDEIKKAIEKNMSDDAEAIIDDLAQVFEVSTQAMTYRLKNLGLLVE